MGDLVRLGKLEDEGRRRPHRPKPGRAVLAGIAEDAPLIAAETRLGDIPLMADDRQALAGPEPPEPDAVILGGGEDDGLLLAVILSRSDLHLVHRQVVMAEDLGLPALEVPAHHLAIVIHRHQVAPTGAEGDLAHRGPVDADLAPIPRDDPQLRQLAPGQVVNPDAVVAEGHGHPLTAWVHHGMVGRATLGPPGRQDGELLPGVGRHHLGGPIEGGRQQPPAIRGEGQGADAAVMDLAIPEGRPGVFQVQDAQGGGAPLAMDEGQVAPARVQGDGRAGARAAGPGRGIRRGGGQAPDARLPNPQRQGRLPAPREPQGVNRQVRSRQGPRVVIALSLEDPAFGAAPGGGQGQALAVVAKGRRQGAAAPGRARDHGHQAVADEGPAQAIRGLRGQIGAGRQGQTDRLGGIAAVDGALGVAQLAAVEAEPGLAGGVPGPPGGGGGDQQQAEQGPAQDARLAVAAPLHAQVETALLQIVALQRFQLRRVGGGEDLGGGVAGLAQQVFPVAVGAPPEACLAAELIAQDEIPALGRFREQVPQRLPALQQHWMDEGGDGPEPLPPAGGLPGIRRGDAVLTGIEGGWRRARGEGGLRGGGRLLGDQVRAQTQQASHPPMADAPLLPGLPPQPPQVVPDARGGGWGGHRLGILLLRVGYQQPRRDQALHQGRHRGQTGQGLEIPGAEAGTGRPAPLQGDQGPAQGRQGGPLGGLQLRPQGIGAGDEAAGHAAQAAQIGQGQQG